MLNVSFRGRFTPTDRSGHLAFAPFFSLLHRRHSGTFVEMAASGGMRHLGRRSRRKARVGSGPIQAMKASARCGSIRQGAALRGCVKPSATLLGLRRRRGGRWRCEDETDGDLHASVRTNARGSVVAVLTALRGMFAGTSRTSVLGASLLPDAEHAKVP